jgi:hypothetical protein
MRHILPRLLHNWMNCLLLGIEHGISIMLLLKVGTLHLKLRMLALKLRMQNLHRCTIQKRSSHKLTRL